MPCQQGLQQGLPQQGLQQGLQPMRVVRRKDPWNLCQPVNIYVYRNGVTGVLPTLVHIPGMKKKNMKTALEVIGDRIKLPTGFPEKLYHTCGIRVCRTTELKMYHEYVVVSSTDMGFRCEDYGRPTSPLVVLRNHDSKHIRNIELIEQNFNIINLRRRMNEDRKSKYAFLHENRKDGLGPTELPYLGGRNCGALCRKVPRDPCAEYLKKSACQRAIEECRREGERPCPTRADPCTPCVPPCQAPQEQGPCNYNYQGQCKPPPPPGDPFHDPVFYNQYQRECEDDLDPECGESPNHQYVFPMPPCRRKTQERGVCTQECYPPPEDDECLPYMPNRDHLLAFVNRYRDIGGQLYRMFHERLNAEHDAGPHDFETIQKEEDWYREHLFETFCQAIEATASSKDRDSDRNNDGFSVPAQDTAELDSVRTDNRGTAESGSGPGSNSADKSWTFDELPDSKTGADGRDVNTSSTSDKRYEPPQLNTQVSLSNLVKEKHEQNQATGTTSPYQVINPSANHKFQVMQAMVQNKPLPKFPETSAISDKKMHLLNYLESLKLERKKSSSIMTDILNPRTPRRRKSTDQNGNPFKPKKQKERTTRVENSLSQSTIPAFLMHSDSVVSDDSESNDDSDDDEYRALWNRHFNVPGREYYPDDTAPVRRHNSYPQSFGVGVLNPFRPRPERPNLSQSLTPNPVNYNVASHQSSEHSSRRLRRVRNMPSASRNSSQGFVVQNQNEPVQQRTGQGHRQRQQRVPVVPLVPPSPHQSRRNAVPVYDRNGNFHHYRFQ